MVIQAKKMVLLRKKKAELLQINPLTGGIVRSGPNRLRSNPLSIYNRGNPFSPILEESSEDSARSTSFSGKPLSTDVTFTRSPGTLLFSRKRFDFSLLSDSSSSNEQQRSTFDSSTQTPLLVDESRAHDSSSTSGFNSGKDDVSNGRSTVGTNTERDLNQAFVHRSSIDATLGESRHEGQTSKAEPSPPESRSLDDKSLQLLSELLFEQGPDNEPIDGKPNDDLIVESKRLHGVIQLRNLLVNVNVRVGVRNPVANAASKEDEKSGKSNEMNFAPNSSN
jgi:hypothetical protein